MTNVFQSGSPSVDNDTFSDTINHPFYGKLTVSVNIENLYIDETTAKFIYDGANLTFTFEIKQTTGSATSRRLTNIKPSPKGEGLIIKQAKESYLAH